MSVNQLYQLNYCSSPTQIVCTGLVYSTAGKGQDGRLCDISSNSGIKLWFMDLVRSLNFQVWIEMFINYSSLEYSEFILAFQLQFGTYEAESEHFQWEKKNAISSNGFPDK